VEASRALGTAVGVMLLNNAAFGPTDRCRQGGVAGGAHEAE